MPTVLIIDDELAIGHIFASEFEEEGFKVLRAFTGDEGLKLALQEKPDAIILDIIMPGLNGYEVCQQIRDHAELAASIIIMMSAKSYKADIDKAMEVGANDYIVKPGELGEVVTVVKKHLQRRSQS